MGVFWPSDANRDSEFMLSLLGTPAFFRAGIFFRHDKDVPKQNKTLLSIELQTEETLHSQELQKKVACCAYSSVVQTHIWAEPGIPQSREHQGTGV